MRSLPPCDLQLYILINYFYLKGSFEKKKKKKNRGNKKAHNDFISFGIWLWDQPCTFSY